MHTVRYAPDTIEALCYLLAEEGANLRILGGGTHLATQLRNEKKRPHGLIWLGDIEEARGIRIVTEDCVEIGATVTMAELSTAAALSGTFGALSQAARTVGSEQIRGMVTLGGNIAGAFYGADTLPPLFLFDAEVQVVGPGGIGWRPVDTILPGGQGLTAQEALLSVRLLRRGGEWRSVFYKLGSRQTATMAQLSLAVAFRLKGETIKETRAFLGALGPQPLEVPDVKKALNGRSPDENAAQILGGVLERFIKNAAAESPACAYKAWAAKAVAVDAMAKIEM